jgi:hypothetical protein
MKIRCQQLSVIAVVVISLLGSEAYSTKAAETFSDMGITNYLHHKMGFHDFFYGPDGVVPKYTGLPPKLRRRTELVARPIRVELRSSTI